MSKMGNLPPSSAADSSSLSSPPDSFLTELRLLCRFSVGSPVEAAAGDAVLEGAAGAASESAFTAFSWPLVDLLAAPSLPRCDLSFEGCLAVSSSFAVLTSCCSTAKNAMILIWSQVVKVGHRRLVTHDNSWSQLVTYGHSPLTTLSLLQLRFSAILPLLIHSS